MPHQERAERVRDIGVRTAMVSYSFVTALVLVSALALALVYGLGGIVVPFAGIKAIDLLVSALHLA